VWASAHCVAKKKELLFTPLQRHQEFGFVGFDRIRMSCRGSENPMPSVYLRDYKTTHSVHAQTRFSCKKLRNPLRKTLRKGVDLWKNCGRTAGDAARVGG